MTRPPNLTIIPYTNRDDEAALSLEEKCVQGKSIVLKFRRPTFEARSKVYDNYKILCAKSNEELIGIGAYTKKTVKLHGETIVAAYIYDLRIHPEHRKYGVAKSLGEALLEDIGPDAECIYTLIAGENERALALTRYSFRVNVVVPLTYVIIPVYKMLKGINDYSFSSVSETHRMFLKHNPSVEFVPPLQEEKMLGYVTSVTLKGEHGGCSIWTNENLLAEQVAALSGYFRVLRVFTALFRQFIKLPYIPGQGDAVKSWFLFDFFARDEESVHSLIAAVNNLALAKGKNYIYILLQSDDPLLEVLKKSGSKVFTIPYFFMANGRAIPLEKDRLYIDVRDL